MTFSEAQQEFRNRIYLWAISEFDREIGGGFPDLQEFKKGAAWEVLQFMQTLEKSTQIALSRSLLKRFHPEATKALDKSCSIEEQSICRSLDRFRHDVGVSEINAGKEVGERIKFMSKRKLLKLTGQRFQDSFGSQCVESDRVSAGDPSLTFQVRCSGGWIISTHFWFGRGETLLDYSHGVFSESKFQHHGPKGPYMASLVIGSMLSFCSWLGICSQTQWEHITSDEEANHACDAVIKLSKRFFEVAPKLLNGLEVEKITEPTSQP
jgi:hypothetical protein